MRRLRASGTLIPVSAMAVVVQSILNSCSLVACTVADCPVAFDVTVCLVSAIIALESLATVCLGTGYTGVLRGKAHIHGHLHCGLIDLSRTLSHCLQGQDM